MQPGPRQPNDPSLPSANLAAAEVESQYVNQEQVIAAALFAKQLQADLVGIKRAQIGDGLKVPDVDMNKVMPSEIFKTFRPSGVAMPRPVPAPVPLPPGPPPAPAPAPVFTIPPGHMAEYAPPPGPFTTSVAAVQMADKDQLEFDFDKKAKYDDVIAAIEKLETKLNIITQKLDILTQDKKKLKITLNKDGS